MVIGLFAGVGCGKSRILSILKKDYGFSVIQADKVVHNLYDEDINVINFIIKLCGMEVFINNKIDRKILAKILYNDEEKIKKVNEFIHPIVWEYISNTIKKNSTINYVVEAALLPKDYSIYDIIWTVDVDLDIRIKRLQESRCYNIEKIQSIINNQPTITQYHNIADKIINNSGSIEQLKDEIRIALGVYRN